MVINFLPSKVNMALVLFQVLSHFIIKNSNIYKSRENKIINPVYQLSTGWAFIFAVSWTCLLLILHPRAHPSVSVQMSLFVEVFPFCPAEIVPVYNIAFFLSTC